MVDIHTHLLFGVDDGPDSIEESVEMLKAAKAQGIHTMILTPHYRHGMFVYPNKAIEENFAQLSRHAERIGVKLHLGTEHHVNSRTIEYIETGRCRTLAGTHYVLAEYKPETEFAYIKNSVQELLRYGYIPIVAHIERYMCMHTTFLKNVELLRELGVMIQVNANAVIGLDGGKIKRFVKKLLKNQYVDFIGSDSHDMKERINNMGKCAEYLYKKYDEAYVDDILEGNAMILLQSEKR